MRLPVWLQAPPEPIDISPIRVDDSTTPRQLTLRTIFAAKKYTFPGAGLLVFHQLGEAMVPVIMGFAIDRAVATGDTRALMLGLLLLALDFAVLSFSFRFGSRIGLLGMQAVQHHLRTRVTDRLLDPRGMGSGTRLPGVALSIATSDVYRLASAVAIGVYPVGEFAAILFGGIVLLIISWPLGVVVIVGAPLMLLLMDKAGASLRSRSEHEQALAGDAAGRATDLVTGYRVLKGVRAEREASIRYRRSSEEALAATLQAKAAQGVFLGSMSLVTGLFVTVIAVAAGLLAIHGTLNVGELITVVGLTQFLMGPLGAFAANFGAIWAAALGSAARVLTVLQTTPSRDTTGRAAGPIVPPDRGASLEVDGVDLGGASDTPFGVYIEPGECVGIVADGAAAQALVDLLAVRRTTGSGAVRVAGVDLQSVDPELARSVVLVAPHSADLFEGRIIDNVALPGTTPERVADALAAAGCTEMIEALPDGVDTLVGEGGARLSGGQRQRVALARALAQDAPVLVLHDPTTAVDSVTEASIAQELRRSRSGRTTVLVTSSPALLAATDRVVSIGTGAGLEPAGVRREPGR